MPGNLPSLLKRLFSSDGAGTTLKSDVLPLTDSVSSDSSVMVASAKAVKTAYEKAVAAQTKASDSDKLDGKDSSEFVPLASGVATATSFKGAGTGVSSTGFKLANGTDIGTLFAAIADKGVQSVGVATSGSGSYLSGLSASIDSNKKLNMTVTKVGPSYCSYCSYCTTSNCDCTYPCL
jgi:hypothetical protein